MLDACWLRLIRFGNKIASTADDDMYKRILLDNLDRAVFGNANWSRVSRELLKGALCIGFNFPLRCHVLEPVEQAAFEQHLHDMQSVVRDSLHHIAPDCAAPKSAYALTIAAFPVLL